MSTQHKNKAFATLLALVLGSVGAHRFYLRGSLDKLGLLHLTTVPMTGMIIGLAPEAEWFWKLLPMILSAMVGFLEAMILGLMPDAKFDAAFNPDSGRSSASSWVLALLLVAAMVLGATGSIFALARFVALISTGNADG